MSVLDMISWSEGCICDVLVGRADCVGLVLQSFLVTLADRAGLQLTDFVGTGTSACQLCVHAVNNRSSIL